jgi:hypothetical protein
MNNRIRWFILSAALLAVAAEAAFTPPTREQLQAAAKEPALVVALLQDANSEQVAEVGRDVVIEIVRLGLKPKDRDVRISQLVEYLFKAMSEEDSMELAIAMGKAVAGSPTASMSADTVSAVQLGIILAVNVEHANAFGNAYNLAMQTIAGAPGGGKTVPPQPPPPPVALPYEAQRLG